MTPVSRGALFILIIGILNNVFAIQYITTFQDPAIAPRSSFAYQAVNVPTLPYKYIAAYGYDGDRSKPEVDQFEYHDVDSRISQVAQTDVNFPTISYPIVTIKRFGYASLTGIPISNNTALLTDVAPGYSKGTGSCITIGTVNASTVYFSVGYNPDTNRTLNYSVSLRVNKANPNNVGFGYTANNLYTTRGAIDPHLIETAAGQVTILSFGGWNASANTFASDWLEFDGKQLTPLTFTGGPSARAFFSSVYLPGQKRAVFVGGRNATSYFNDVFQFNLANRGWSRISPAPDSNYGFPAPRIGHSLNFLTDREDTLYMFGGTNGTNFFNDLWALKMPTVTPAFAGAWIRLDNPSDPLQSRVTPRAFHRGGDLFNDTTSLLFFLGGKAADGSNPPAIAVDLASNCSYFCQSLPEVCLLLGSTQTKLCSQKGGCTSYDVCQRATVCGSSQIKCGITCVDSNATVGFAGCPPRDPKYPCPNDTPFVCWNSICALSPLSCTLLPPCPINTYRCPDGSCTLDIGTCGAHQTCSIGEKACPDGTCVRTSDSCTPILGCSGSDPSAAFQCSDGTCRGSLSECVSASTRNCTDDELPCWDDCYESYANCSMPYWSKALRPRSDTITVNGNGGSNAVLVTEYYSSPFLITSNHYFIKVDNFESSPVTISWKVGIPSIDYNQIGPHPTWDQEYSPDFLCSIIADIKTTGISAATANNQNVQVNMLIRHQFQTGDPIPILPGKLCFGAVVPWYWNVSDAGTNSPLGNISYFAKYRLWYFDSLQNASASGTTTFDTNPPGLDFGQPLFRWTCLNKGSTDTGNQWPRWLDSQRNEIANQTVPDQWHGILLLDDLNGPVGIIKWNKTTPDTVNPVSPQPAPPNELAHYIVLGVVGALLLVLIIVVTMKAVARQN